jgi:predicted small lipoprotein YifL
MMKRIICGLLVCLMLFSMVACGTDAPPAPVGSDSADTQAQGSEEGSDAISDTSAPTESQSAVGTKPTGETLTKDETLEVPRVNYGGTAIRILQKD